jgi:hypothetical protein
MPYDPAISEPRWQKAWDDAGTFRAVRDERPKYYVLEMFPYPSGRIHMGHVRNYTMGDVVARFKRAQAFPCCIRWAGTPSGCRPKTPRWNRAAIPATGPMAISPHEAAAEAAGPVHRLEPRIRHLRRRLRRPAAGAVSGHAGCGLVTRKSAQVNWDPVDMTVLANEQVIDGKGWRSGALVERQGADAVVLPHLGLFGGAAERAGRADRLARKGAADAGQLDRQVARAAIPLCHRRRARRFRHDRGLYDPPRHADGGKLRGAVARSSAGEIAGPP